MKEISTNDLRRESVKIQHKTLSAIKKVIKNARYILGEDLRLFENNFANYNTNKFAVGVSNGTSALFLALKALGIGPGDEVITTSFSFIATAEAIAHTGAKPVFVDVNPKTLSIDENKIESLINHRTKAILPVHLYGTPANLSRIKSLCNKYKLKLIEDCAQAHGALYKNEKVGSRSDAGCFSFMPAKNIGAYGDAGCVVTNNKKMAEKLKMLRDHGRKTKYVHEELGYAERMDNLQAAVLNVKLKYLDRWNNKRKKVAVEYDKSFKKAGIKILEIPSYAVSSRYTYPIIIDHRDQVAKLLNKDGIKTIIYYPIPLHLQPAFSYLGYKPGSLPIVEELSGKVLSLPIHPFLSAAEVKYIINKVIKHVNETKI